MPNFIHALKLALAPWACDPSDIPGCVLWLRASDNLVTAGVEQRVTTWTDKVGHLTLTPVDVASAPVHLDWVPALNGLPGIGFYAGTSVLHKAGGLPLAFGDEPFSMFALCSPENEGESDSMLAQWEGTVPHGGLGFVQTGELYGYFEGVYDAGVAPRQFAPHTLGAVYDGQGTLELYVDDARTNTYGGLSGAAADAGLASVLTIGGDTSGRRGFRGHLGDLVAFNRALSASEAHYVNVTLTYHYKGYSGWAYEGLFKLARAAGALLKLIGSELGHLFGFGGDR